VHAELLQTAHTIMCAADEKEPSRTALRRAISTAYYALFHHLSANCADLLLGAEPAALTRAKMHVYRSIDHRDIVSACHAAKPSTDFPQPICDYATLFLNMYKSRCNADYDPSELGDFRIPQVLHKLGEVAEAIRRFDTADLNDRRAFAVLVAVKKPKGDRK
jgi:hypothetical protein